MSSSRSAPAKASMFFSRYVRAIWLRATDRECCHLLCHSARLEFEQVGASIVDTGHQQADTVRPFSVVLRVDLGLLANHIDQDRTGMERPYVKR